MKKRVCIIGMGRFGMGVARELYQAGHDVLVIDTDDEKVQVMLGQTTYAVRADATNESTLRELGVADYDVAVLTLGDQNVQASILIGMVLKSMTIPYIIARATNEMHGEALERIGVDRVVYPEEESARRVAHVDFNYSVIDYMEIVANAGISKIRPPEQMVNRTLEEAGLAGANNRHSLAVVAVRRGRSYILNPSKDEEVKPGDVLLVVGRSEHVAEISALAQEQANAAAAQGLAARLSR